MAYGTLPYGTGLYKDGPDEIDDAGDFSIMFALSQITTPANILRFAVNELVISLTFAGGQFTLTFTDAIGSLSQVLNWDGAGYVFLKIDRDVIAGTLRISEDKVVHSLQNLLVGNVDYGGKCEVMPGSSGSVYDVRIYDKIISTETFHYYQDDIIDNNGYGVCHFI